MGFAATRNPFNPTGPFVALKSGTTGGIELVPGDAIPAGGLDHVGPRKLKQMWETRWIDCAPAALTAEDLFDAARDALASIGMTFEEWLTLDAAARADALDRAKGAAPAPAEPIPTPSVGEGAPETPASDSEGETGTEEQPPTPPAPPVGEQGKPVAVFNEGFGRWFGRDEAGNKVGERMTKAQADATGLPEVAK